MVADTGDFRTLAEFKPQDATTNPSLILKAVQNPDYRPLLTEGVQRYSGRPVEEIIDRLLVRFGTEILSIVPGRVSTEVDARFAFDTAATVRSAERILKMYQAEGVDTTRRVLIKIAATWEGIEAARQLEQRGIHCNLTLVFSLAQAIACGEAKVKLISPFVGRIYDWYKQSAGAAWDEAANADANDPGVRSVREIYSYFKANDIRTEVMGASFRNVGQITALAGCDLVTVSTALLAALARSDAPLVRSMHPEGVRTPDRSKPVLDQPRFRFALNEDAMATEKLAEGIRGFAADARKMESLIEASS